jgi:hypothetical protein
MLFGAQSLMRKVYKTYKDHLQASEGKDRTKNLMIAAHGTLPASFLIAIHQPSLKYRSKQRCH